MRDELNGTFIVKHSVLDVGNYLFLTTDNKWRVMFTSANSEKTLESFDIEPIVDFINHVNATSCLCLPEFKRDAIETIKYLNLQSKIEQYKLEGKIKLMRDYSEIR